MQRITAIVTIAGEEHVVELVKVGLDDDRCPWRVEAPDDFYDGWLMSQGELRAIEAAS